VTCGCEGDVVEERKDGKAGIVSNVARTSRIAAKPFVTMRTLKTMADRDVVELHVPTLKTQTCGVAFNDDDDDDVVPFEYVYYARADRDAAASIQGQIDEGYHVVLAPGIFHLETGLVVRRKNQVILGLGMATLMAPTDGTPCITVPSDIDGVRLAGITLQASTAKNHTLLDVSGSSVANPTILSDVFARVGGPDLDRTGVGCDVMICIHADGVIGDNLWLWRADHSIIDDVEDPPDEAHHLVVAGEFPCETALRVDGKSVTIYGLACEHVTKNQVVWNGDQGTVIFYQCELPYDVDHASFSGFSGYVVDDAVESHQAWGLGIYSFFRDAECQVESAITAPDKPNVVFKNAYTRFLNARGHGRINHVINQTGGASWRAQGPDPNVPERFVDGVFPIIRSYPESQPEDPQA